jgi:hypothetical protein
MATTSNISRRPRARAKAKGPGAAAIRPAIVGVTYDGVKVLQPKLASSHFTVDQVRESLRQTLGAEGMAEIVRASRAAADET